MIYPKSCSNNGPKEENHQSHARGLWVWHPSLSLGQSTGGCPIQHPPRHSPSTQVDGPYLPNPACPKIWKRHSRSRIHCSLYVATSSRLAGLTAGLYHLIWPMLSSFDTTPTLAHNPWLSQLSQRHLWDSFKQTNKCWPNVLETASLSLNMAENIIEMLTNSLWFSYTSSAFPGIHLLGINSEISRARVKWAFLFSIFNTHVGFFRASPVSSRPWLLPMIKRPVRSLTWQG